MNQLELMKQKMEADWGLRAEGLCYYGYLKLRHNKGLEVMGKYIKN